MRVFLGGTCNGAKWRGNLIKELQMKYFNPVVKDWTPECVKEEQRQKLICDFHLYVITPEMQGVYSIAEAIDSSNKTPEKTIFCVEQSFTTGEFTLAQLRSLTQVGQMVQENGGMFFGSISHVVTYLNAQMHKEPIRI